MRCWTGARLAIHRQSLGVLCCRRDKEAAVRRGCSQAVARARPRQCPRLSPSGGGSRPHACISTRSIASGHERFPYRQTDVTSARQHVEESTESAPAAASGCVPAVAVLRCSMAARWTRTECSRRHAQRISIRSRQHGAANTTGHGCTVHASPDCCFGSSNGRQSASLGTSSCCDSTASAIRERSAHVTAAGLGSCRGRIGQLRTYAHRRAASRSASVQHSQLGKLATPVICAL
jgi:hypothetical protein